MNFVFIIDTSPSMIQRAYHNLTILDTAKTTLEIFIKSRLKWSESKFDQYFLLTTSTKDNLLSSWADDVSHLFK